MFFFKVLLLLFLIISIKVFANNKFVVVVSKNSKISKLSKTTISKLFLSKSKSFPNGKRAIPIEINNSELQLDFYKKITNKNEKQLSKYWAKMIFTGKGTPPKKFKTIANLKNFIKRNKNAITYLNKNYLDKDLKVLLELTQ